MFRGGGPPPGSIVLKVNHTDNPWFPDVLRDEMEHDRLRNIEKYLHVWEGEHLRFSEALIFTNWKIVDFDTPGGAVPRFGADWGYANDPTVLVRCFIGRWAGEPGRSDIIPDQGGKCLFIDHEVARVGCEIDDLPSLFAGSDLQVSAPRWSNRFGYPGVPGARSFRITADASRPETISYLKNRGFNIEPARKGKDSVEEGITFLQSYDIYVHPRCTQTAVELAHYRWKTDKLTSQIIAQPEDRNNHVIDALRYGLEAVRGAESGHLEFYFAGPRLFGRYDRTLSDLWHGYDDGEGWGSVPSFMNQRLENIF